MGLIINQHNESIQFSRLKNLVTHGDTIRIISSDGDTRKVSKFILSFFCDIFQHDQDCIITPIESSILSVIVDLLNLKKNVAFKYLEYYELLGLDTKGLKSVWEILNLKSDQDKKIKRIKSADKDVVKEGGMPLISNLFCELPSFINVLSIKNYEDKNSDISDISSKSSSTVVVNGDSNKAMKSPEACHQSQVNKNQSKDMELPIGSNEDGVVNVYKDQEMELAVQQDDGKFCKSVKENECQNNEKEVTNSNLAGTATATANNRKEQNREKRISVKRRTNRNKEDILCVRKGYKDNIYGDPIVTRNNTQVITVECRLCGKVFDRRQYSQNNTKIVNFYYKNHFLRHHILTKKCCDYDLTGATKEQKIKHFYIVHQGFLGCTENENCPSYFRTEEALKDHAKLHKETNDKCDKCDYTSPFPRNLRHHKERVHDVTKNLLLKLKKDERFECLECNRKQFFSERQLNAHKLARHTFQECKDCGKEIVGAQGMRKHVARFHCAEENMKVHCDRCGKGFIDIHRLKSHMDSIHLGVVFYCRYPICDKKLQPYRNTGNRDSHERKRHGQNFNVLLRQNKNQDNVNLSSSRS